MASPRRFKAELQLTPYFHCTSRCVRGSYLCGVNRESGADYTHRRKWLANHLQFLAECFSIKLAAYTVMENHFHVVLRVEKEVALSWPDSEVVSRWHRIFKGNEISQRFANSKELSSPERIKLSGDIKRWRLLLQDISWFMRCAKEPLARLANKEDKCKGRFWDGRFHSQALLDTKAVIACMAYVDLNPVRAKVVSVPESDPYTSFKLRFLDLTQTRSSCKNHSRGLVDLACHDQPLTVPPPINLKDYILLVDSTARQVRPNKRGYVPEHILPILAHIGINADGWSELGSSFNSKFSALVGGRDSLAKACELLNIRNTSGQRACAILFGS